VLYGTAASFAVASNFAFGQNRSASGAGQAASGHPPPPARGAVADTQWTAFAGDNRSNRYSPLDQINASNFNNLQLAWRFDAARMGPRVETNWESTPLLIKGRIYVTAGARRNVICLDAATGEMIWMHREDEGERAAAAPRQLSGRGCSYWTDGKTERIIFVTTGYRLKSLDINTGIPDPRFGRGGVVDLKLENDQQIDLVRGEVALQASPMVCNDVIVVGAAHRGGTGPSSVLNVKGNIRGYDARTGRRLWIFHTIPQKGEYGYDSWVTDGQGAQTGNAGSWANMCADAELNTVYVGIELPTGDYTGMYRRGPGLFGESLVALDLKTGRRKWHYQMIHHGIWDSDVPCSAMIVDLPVNGRTVKAIAQPTKQSFLYVLNRETGEPIWPIPETPVPAGDVPGEWYSPTQPIPSKPPAYDRQSVLDDDLIDFTPAIKARALEIANHYNRGKVYHPPTLSVWDGKWGTLMLPGAQGGTNWPGGCFDPETKIAYIYSKTTVFLNGIVPNSNAGPGRFAYVGGAALPPGEAQAGRGGGDGEGEGGGGGGRGGGRGGRGAASAGGDPLSGPLRPGLTQVAGLPLVKPPYGRITALDLKDGSMAWQVAHGETPDNIRNHPLLKGLNVPRTGQTGNVGPLVTKTLVICGDPQNTTNAQGVNQAWLRAYDKATGREVGAIPMAQGQTGTPMTYAVGGWQYIVLCIGNSADRGSEMLAFRLRSV
jgi:quinoprotein glucose dehydrogenase